MDPFQDIKRKLAAPVPTPLTSLFSVESSRVLYFDPDVQTQASSFESFPPRKIEAVFLQRLIKIDEFATANIPWATQSEGKKKQVLTFKWRRCGARGSGGDVDSMCSVGMYRSLRSGARGGGARNAPSLSWQRGRFRRISSRGPNKASVSLGQIKTQLLRGELELMLLRVEVVSDRYILQTRVLRYQQTSSLDFPSLIRIREFPEVISHPVLIFSSSAQSDFCSSLSGSLAKISSSFFCCFCFFSFCRFCCRSFCQLSLYFCCFFTNLLVQSALHRIILRTTSIAIIHFPTMSVGASVRFRPSQIWFPLVAIATRFRRPSLASSTYVLLPRCSFNKSFAKMAQNGRKTPLTDDITLQIFL